MYIFESNGAMSHTIESVKARVEADSKWGDFLRTKTFDENNLDARRGEKFILYISFGGLHS